MSGYIMRMSRGLLPGLLLLAALLGVQFAASQRASAAPSAPVRIVAAADRADACNTKANGATGFFGLKPWYYYMDEELGQPKHGDTPADACGVRCFNIFVQGSSTPNECGQTKSDIPGIILVVIDDLLRIGGLVAVAFVIIGAFQYVSSRGNSERTAAAQSTIMSALVGLIITLVAVAVISFLGNRLT
jgi:hypothetical protein